MKYELQNKIWTEKDFDQMGWHDCHIYKIRMTTDLELDIDYIFQWNKPEVEGLPFTFWVAPTTLVFKEISAITFELDTAFEDALEIEDIEKAISDNKTSWTILTQQGNLSFSCENFQLFVRQEPFFEFGQTISLIERGGLSLEQTTNQDNPNRFRDDIIERRNKDLEYYQNAQKRQLKRQEKEQLKKARDNNDLDIKQYLLKKKEIDEMLDYHDLSLKGTRFENW